MELRLSAFPDGVEGVFTDDGVAYEASATPAPESGLDPLDLPEGGFGLALTLAAVDKLDYTRTRSGRNRWRLVKKF